MAKKKEEIPDEGSPAWMSTFSDLMNLLLCFFVLLFASSTMDEGKIQKIAASFQTVTFSIFSQSSTLVQNGDMVSGGVTQLPNVTSIMEIAGKATLSPQGENQDVDTANGDSNGEPGSAAASTENNSSNEDSAGDTGKTTTEDSAGNTGETTTEDSAGNTGEATTEDSSGNTGETSTEDHMGDSGEASTESTESLEDTLASLQAQLEAAGMEQSLEMYKQISELLESYAIDDKVQIDYNYQYVELDMNGALLFDTGEAGLKEGSYVFMDKIASILEIYRNSVIEIEGHTDNVPIHTSKYESNRYLSTARATNVYEYLMDHANLIDENMKVAGYGESRPAASNDTPEGRARNRRVVIKIYNPLSSKSQD